MINLNNKCSTLYIFRIASVFSVTIILMMVGVWIVEDIVEPISAMNVMAKA